MSLQLVANHLAQKGRGPDSTLVHMSNREVAGLQALAKRHGGELSVNPDTGLPEAGFLDSILPTIAGAGLAYFGMNPMMAAGLVGGIKALDSKDLSQGLMAGLGAYGGAGLTAGLMGAGATSLGSDAARAADNEWLGPLANPTGEAAREAAIANASGFDKLSAGAGQLFSNPGQTLQAIGGGSQLAGAGILGAAAAPIIADEMVETTTEAPPQERGKIRPYTYSRQQIPQDYQDQQGNMGSKERRYFNDSYTAGDPYSAAGGGLVALAAGGYTNQNIFQPTTPLPENNMYGASRDAYNYLMGVNPTSGGGQTRPYNPYPMEDIRIDDGKNLNPSTPKTGTGRYEYDPVTRQYRWIPDPIKPVDVAAPVFENPMQAGGGGRGEREPEDPNSFSAQWAAMNDAEKEAWRAENPNKAIAQDVVGFLASPLKFAYDKIQEYMGPEASTGGPARYERTPVVPDASLADIDTRANPMSLDPAQRAALGEGVGRVPGAGVSMGSGISSEGVGRTPGAGVSMGPDEGGPVGRTPGEGVSMGPAPSAPPNESNPGDTGRGGGIGGGGAGRDGGGGPSNGNPGDPGRGGGGAHLAHGGIANLHQYNLGSYSDGGRLLKGPGDGVSDDIPATIGHGQPARLADGEFVIPARIVSELGNGSTDAGARELYKMMDRIQAGRKKTVGKDQVAKNSKSARHLPA